MIPINDIKAWSNIAPWINDEQIEQDLIISRSLVELFSDEYLIQNLAFRGGTAIHKLFLIPQQRYSEDIDLVQINSGPIRKMMDNIREKLSFLGEPVVKQKKNNNTLVFKFLSSGIPAVPLRLKIEINCREHFIVMGLREVDFNIDTRWFKGNCKIRTYHPEELLGTKLRAVYQRKKGRDLYDIYKALTTIQLNISELIRCYREYMTFSADHIPTRKQFILNMEEKITDPAFLGDLTALLRPDELYNPQSAWELVKTEIIEKL